MSIPKLVKVVCERPLTLDAQTDISVTIVLSASYASSSFSKFLFKSVSRARPGLRACKNMCVFLVLAFLTLSNNDPETEKAIHLISLINISVDKTGS